MAKDPQGEYGFHVRSYECGPDGTATFPALCNYLQEAASLHAKSLGFSKSDFEAAGRNITWVLARMRVCVARYPDWDEEMLVVTRPKLARKLAAYRDFEMTDASGGLVLRAASEWMVIDTAARRAVPVPQEIFASFEITVPPVLGSEAPFTPRLKFPADAPAAPAKEYTAMRSHIDLNGHVNNVRYMEWMLESAPDSAAMKPRDIEFAFRGETFAGETVTSRSAPSLDGRGLFYSVSSAGGVECLAARDSSWSPSQGGESFQG